MIKTRPLAPTDAEIEALADINELYVDYLPGRSSMEYLCPVKFARAVLAKWGARPVAAPVDDFPVARKSHGAWDGIEDVLAMPDGTEIYTTSQVQAMLAAAPDMTDAYAGAREDLSIWKKRALEAEALNRKFAASVNSPSFMGEPAAPAGMEPVARVEIYPLDTDHNYAWRAIPLTDATCMRDGDLLCQMSAQHTGTVELAAPSGPVREPLTDEQIQEIWNKASGAIPGWSRHIAYARAIEAAHGIK